MSLSVELAKYSIQHRLNAEIVLAHVLGVNRNFLHMYPEKMLSVEMCEQFHFRMSQVMQGYPVAYLTGRKEFWSLDLLVNEHTLIPRSETELLVELVLKNTVSPTCSIADLGTGSGAIALALASEMPGAEIYATDISFEALTIAKKNAANLALQNITFSHGEWCDALPRKKFDTIVSNPPYIALDDVHVTKSVRDYEPHTALFSDDQGLAHSRHIIFQALSYLKPGGSLLLEHGFGQAEKLRTIFSDCGYEEIVTHTDFAGHDRVTVGRIKTY